MPLRTVLINRGRPDEHIFVYSANAVYTTKYSIWTFIPKFLFEQFSRYANLFFLIVAFIQQIPGITPISRWGTAVPLAIIILITGVKEVAEDVRRKRADDRANNAPCEVFDRVKGTFDRRKWEQVCVGDLVRVLDGQEFPADLVLLDSSAEEGTCFVETSNIDGETNLKTRERAPTPFDGRSLAALTGLIKCDEPNNRIYELEGLIVLGEHEIPIGPNQTLLRGSKLQNTEWIVGVAIYTGRDTKIVMNSRTTRIKRSSIEKMTNRQIIYLFLMLLIIVTSCFGAFYVTTLSYTRHIPYLYASYELNAEMLMKKFFTFLVLMNNLVPISLIMTMEIIRVRLGMLIDSDVDLYCEESDTPAVAKTTSLVEELGQVQYIFSDKTGTLTRNEMVLRRLCVRGKTTSSVGGEERLHLQEYPGLDQMLLVMATCNTAVVGRRSDGPNGPQLTTYQSSSPDEVAIVEAAAALGTSLVERRVASITVRSSPSTGDAATASRSLTFQIIAVLEFDSARKRMSVVLRDEQGLAWLFSKGADAVMWPRLASGQDATQVRATERAMSEMALVGFRTLVFGYRQLGEDELESWLEQWKRAQTATQQRKEGIYEAMDLIERDLTLAGVSGVEDRLQEAVPETIEKLHGASIRLWVLTGDKMETAVNIGYSCKLLTPATQMLQLSLAEGIEGALRGFSHCLVGGGVSVGMDGDRSRDKSQSQQGLCQANAAIIVEATALQAILEDELLQNLFVETARSCCTVICCRVSPSQKAKVVEMVQRREHAVCLAIGDGANDVGMIQAAQIGVGISGKEGLQAARSADFSIAQFRFLQKLLLVHGAWGYHRISKAAIFCVYKNILLYACQFWYAYVTLFSGQTAFESWMIGFYNVVFTAWPPIVIGLTDQFVTAPFLLSHPSLYRLGQENTFYNPKTFWQSAVNGFGQSLLAFALTVAIVMNGSVLHDGRDVGLFYMGTIAFAGLILTCVLKAALLINYWTLYTVLGLLVCPVSWIVYVLSYDGLSRLLGSPSNLSDLLGMSRPLFGSAVFWLTALLIPIVCLLRDALWKFYKRQFMPQEYHIVQELQREEKHSASTTGSREKLRARSLTIR